MIDYTGLTVFIGIDVHKRTYSLTAVHEGSIVKRATLTANHEELISFIFKFFKGAKIITAYEAGFCGFSLHRSLIKHGIENHIINPSSIEVKARERTKTDKRDSEKLATQLYAGRLKGIHVPSLSREKQREITRLRKSYIEMRSVISRQLKMFLYRHNLIEPDDRRRVSKKWFESFESKVSYSEELKFAFNEQSKSWIYYDNKINEIDLLLKEQAKNDCFIHEIYRSAPGIGNTAARIFSNELGDLSQFSSQKKLYSFTGLTPMEFSSGDHQRLGHISRQSRSDLRRLLIECAWTAVRVDPNLQELFEQIARRRGCRKAIVGIARRLIGRIRACFLHNTTYGKLVENVVERVV